MFYRDLFLKKILTINSSSVLDPVVALMENLYQLLYTIPYSIKSWFMFTVIDSKSTAFDSIFLSYNAVFTALYDKKYAY